MGFYITGDTHGGEDGGFKKFSNSNNPLMKNLNEEDYVLILGDFGLFFNEKITKEEKYWLDFLENKPFKILFLAGNHENYDILNTFEDFKYKNGIAGKVKIKKEFCDFIKEDVEYKNIIFLKNGEVYNFNEKNILIMGGAFSGDNYINYEKNYIEKKLKKNKYLKKENIKVPKKYWKEEIPSKEIFEKGLKNLIEKDIDIILSHTAPQSIVEKMFNFENEKNLKSIFSENLKNKNKEYLGGRIERLFEDEVSLEFENWYSYIKSILKIKEIIWGFGHTHLEYEFVDNMNNKFINLYKGIKKIF